MSIEIILKEYDEKVALYRSFRERVEGLLKHLIEEKGINTHSVTGRVKDRPSLEKKFHKKNGKYNAISDITDIVGVRIITFFDNDVNYIADLIKENFNVDLKNSVDKKSSIDPDKFGYLSVHLICKMDDLRAQSLEWKRFSDVCFEVQIRSILQHAWAEIEHDIGYKSAIEVPRIIRRRFSRVAGLLELADEELSGIKMEIEEYSENLPRIVMQSPETVAIDSNSIAAFIASNELVKEIDKILSEGFGVPLRDNLSKSNIIEFLNWFGIDNIGELTERLNANQEEFRAFCLAYINMADRSDMKYLPSGISVFIYCYFLAVKLGGSKFRILKYLEDNSIAISEERSEFADTLITIYQASLGQPMASSS